MRKGIDVSKYQGTIDWARVKADGIQFAILRAGYGKLLCQKDPTFDRNYAECTRLCIPVGAYWYSYADTIADVQAEMAAFLTVLAGKQFQYPVCFDQEYEPCIKALDNATRTQLVKTALSTLEGAGYYAALYASANWVNQWLNYKELTQYDLWAAQYGTSCGAKLPTGIWQYTSKGRVNGIHGDVDCNYAYRDYPVLIRAAGLNGCAPQTPALAKPDTGAGALSTLTIGPMSVGDRQTITAMANTLGLPVACKE